MVNVITENSNCQCRLHTAQRQGRLYQELGEMVVEEFVSKGNDPDLVRAYVNEFLLERGNDGLLAS